MPPVPSASSTEQDEGAFQVLNQDNLFMAVIGEPILSQFNSEGKKAKPNLIVHPIRRITNNVEEGIQKYHTNTSINHQNDCMSRKKAVYLHGNLGHNNSTAQMKIEDLNIQTEIDRFNNTLDFKLKKLQKEENKHQKRINCEPSSLRKPFVTTVKKGQFLEPPPEIASLIGIRLEEQKYVKKNPKEVHKLYAFASHPRVLSRTPPGFNVIHTRNNLDSHHPHERKKNRDKNFTSTLDDQPKWNPNFAYAKLLSIDEQNPNIATTRILQAQRRALARKRAKHQQVKRPKRDATSLTASDDYPEKLLDISQFQQIFRLKEQVDAATQTEEISIIINQAYENLKSDAQIQVHPTDLFDFNTEVQPVVEILVSRTIEEALIEVLEEEELLAVKEQQRKFLEYMAENLGDNLEINKEMDIKASMIKNISKTIKHNYIPSLVTSV